MARTMEGERHLLSGVTAGRDRTNPALVRKSYPRAAHEFYIEPVWVTAAVLKLPFFTPVRGIWDPCCGSANVLQAVATSGRYAEGSDISGRAVGNMVFPVRDFLTAARLPPACDSIVFNPPFGGGELAMAFITHALALEPMVLAALVDLRFLASAKRAPFFRAQPPAAVAILSPRPSCPPGELLLAGDIKATGGTQDYCWLIWARFQTPGPTQTIWLIKPTETR